MGGAAEYSGRVFGSVRIGRRGMNSHDASHAPSGQGQSRMRRFLRKPWREKAGSVFFRWVRVFPGIPIPVRLPFGGWWLARNDFVGAALFQGGFENTEC